MQASKIGNRRYSPAFNRHWFCLEREYSGKRRHWDSDATSGSSVGIYAVGGQSDVRSISYPRQIEACLERVPKCQEVSGAGVVSLLYRPLCFRKLKRSSNDASGMNCMLAVSLSHEIMY